MGGRLIGRSHARSGRPSAEHRNSHQTAFPRYPRGIATSRGLPALFGAAVSSGVVAAIALAEVSSVAQ